VVVVVVPRKRGVTGVTVVRRRRRNVVVFVVAVHSSSVARKTYWAMTQGPKRVEKETNDGKELCQRILKCTLYLDILNLCIF
jgi:hypothetical protein